MTDSSIPDLHWQLARFRELDLDALYALLRLRSEVFVLEQACAYLDLDDRDRHPDMRHLLGRDARGDLVAYARLVPPGVSFPEPSIGRVVTSPAQRGRGLGEHLVARAVKDTLALWPGRSIRIGAQSYLLAFYARHGFEVASEEYLEDGIPHREMIRK